MDGYRLVGDASYKSGIFERCVNNFCQVWRIYGMDHFGCSWAIPGNSAESVDPSHLRKAELKGSKRGVGGHQL